MRRSLTLLLCVALASCVGTVGNSGAGGGSTAAGGGSASSGGGAAASSGGGSAASGGGSATGGSGGASAGGGTGGGTAGGTGGGAAGGGSGGGDAGTDGGVDAGFSCLGRIVCDDFEGSGFPRAPFQITTSGGSGHVALDTTRAVSGTHSVMFTIDATTPSDTYRHAMLSITGAPLIPLANDSFYGRFMIFTDRIPDQTVHWTFAHGDGPVGDGTSSNYNLGGMGGLMANYYRDTNPAADCWQTKDVPFPSATWVCVAFSYDGQNNEIRFWLDGVEVPELHVLGNQKTAMTCTDSSVDGKWYAPQFQNVGVGWESYQHDVDGGHVAWIDDVVFDTAPIPCP